MDNCLPSLHWILDPVAVRHLLQKLQLQENVIDFVCNAAQQLAQSEDIPAFLEFCTSWQQRLNDPQTNALPSGWKALAVIASYPEAIKKYQQRGVPWEIIRATLADFQRDARGDYLTGTSWNFDRLSWMNNHVNARIFELGRLQYAPGTFSYPYRIYRDAESNAPVAFALPNLHCTTDGWIEDDATGFITQLQAQPDGIYGNAASPLNGSIVASTQRISPQSPLLIDRATSVLHVHIPSGQKLDLQECIASLKTAIDFFARYFPESQIKGLCISTWLLDPELKKVLSDDSNIVQFAHLFHPLARQNANDTQLLERVFGKDATWDNCIAQTSLQKAVLQHHRNGGVFRIGAGYILPEKIIRL